MSEREDGIGGAQVAGFLFGALVGGFLAGAVAGLLTSLGVESPPVHFATYVSGATLVGYAGARWGPSMVIEVLFASWR